MSFDWSRRQNSIGDHNHTADQIKNLDTGETVSPTSETFVTELVTSETFITEVTTNETYITQITNNSTFVTNTNTIINANLNGKKGIANELATLDSGSHLTPSQVPPALLERTIVFVIDGGGASPTTGVKPGVEMPVAGTITSARIFADQSGSAVVDIKKASYANLPGSLSSIAASAKPTLSSAQKNQDSTLTGWTKTFSAGDWLVPNLDSVTTCLWIVVTIRFTVTV